MGAEDRTATIVEFFDYNCPYCKRAAADVKALLEGDDTVRWSIANGYSGRGVGFCGTPRSPHANKGLYEELHWALMELRGRAEEASVLAAARDVGLDIDQLLSDMESEAISEHIATSRGLAQSLGFTGTSFVIGDSLVPGAIPLAELENLISLSRTETK